MVYPKRAFKRAIEVDNNINKNSKNKIVNTLYLSKESVVKVRWKIIVTPCICFAQPNRGDRVSHNLQTI